jgi:hypothetical protein
VNASDNPRSLPDWSSRPRGLRNPRRVVGGGDVVGGRQRKLRQPLPGVRRLDRHLLRTWTRHDRVDQVAGLVAVEDVGERTSVNGRHTRHNTTRITGESTPE